MFQKKLYHRNSQLRNVM